ILADCHLLQAADLSYDLGTRRLTAAVTVHNPWAVPREARLELDYNRDGGPPQGTRVLDSGMLPPGATVTRTITLRVPASAPPGSYNFTLRLVDVAAGETCGLYTETIAISAPRVGGEDGGGALFEVEAQADLTPAAVASAGVGAAVAPNPF